jgi:hypothetical protein
MYEPKYKLNRKDEARFRKLAVKEALQTATADEKLELEKLSRKRTQKGYCHPKMQIALRCQRNQDRKLRWLCKKIDALIEQGSPAFRRAFGKRRFSDAFKKQA